MTRACETSSSRPSVGCGCRTCGPDTSSAWQADLREQGRGAPTVYRLGATLRSALNHAVRVERLIAYNAADGAIGARPAAAERLCWTALQAAAFLRHNRLHYSDQLADVFEVMLGTGIRRGEVLGLHWADIHFMERKAFVRWTLAAVLNVRYVASERSSKTAQRTAWSPNGPQVGLWRT